MVFLSGNLLLLLSKYQGSLFLLLLWSTTLPTTVDHPFSYYFHFYNLSCIYLPLTSRKRNLNTLLTTTMENFSYYYYGELLLLLLDTPLCVLKEKWIEVEVLRCIFHLYENSFHFLFRLPSLCMD